MTQPHVLGSNPQNQIQECRDEVEPENKANEEGSCADVLQISLYRWKLVACCFSNRRDNRQMRLDLGERSVGVWARGRCLSAFGTPRWCGDVCGNCILDFAL